MIPEISVIIPAYNEESYVENCLKTLDSQTFKNFETIVVDSGKDSTSSIAEKYGAFVIKQGKNGPAAARNAGAKIAKGRVFVFLDADCRVSSDFLSKIHKKFNRPIGGGICQISVYDYERRSDAVLYEILNTAAKIFIMMRFIVTSGSCFVYSKEAFFKVGGFREDLMTNEDHDLARRVGRKARFEVFDDIVVETSSRRLKKLGPWKGALTCIKSASSYLLADKGLKDYWD